MSKGHLTGEMAVLVQDRALFFSDALSLILTTASGDSVTVQQVSADSLLERAEGLRPDVVFLEVHRTPWELNELLMHLSDLRPDIRLIGIGRPSDRRQFEQLHDVIPRTAPCADILRAAGLSDPSAELTDAALQVTSGRNVGLLSGREVKVLSLLSSGWTTAQIADRLSLSQRSVRAVREQLLLKLESQSCAQAVATALRLGLLSPIGVA